MSDDPYDYESVPFKERKRVTFKCCDDKNTEIGRLRAELTKMENAYVQMRNGNAMLRDDNGRLRADNAAKFDKYCRNLTELAHVHKEACDAKDARIAEADAKADAEMERVKACEHIADGDEGWEKVRNLCPSTAAVAGLQDRMTAANARIAELEARTFLGLTQALAAERTRAERAEAEIERLNDDITAKALNMRHMHDRFERAEAGWNAAKSVIDQLASERNAIGAERDALREALVIARQWMPVAPFEGPAVADCFKVDAALNPSRGANACDQDEGA